MGPGGCVLVDDVGGRGAVVVKWPGTLVSEMSLCCHEVGALEQEEESGGMGCRRDIRPVKAKETA